MVTTMTELLHVYHGCYNQWNGSQEKNLIKQILQDVLNSCKILQDSIPKS